MNTQIMPGVPLLDVIRTLADSAIAGVLRRTSRFASMKMSEVQVEEYALAPQERMLVEDFLQHIRRLMSEGRYEQAAHFGRGAHPAFVVASNDDVSLNPVRAEFEAYWGLALVYTAQTSEGIALLQASIANGDVKQEPGNAAAPSRAPGTGTGVHAHFVRGRGYNNLGYAHYTLGCYELALREFKAALPFFHAPDLREEYANTCDNIGRAYVRLYRPNLAQHWIDKALKLRCQLGDEYRLALSYNSQAIFCRTFGLPECAYRLASQTLCICQRLEQPRGTAAAYISLGSALRQMASHLDIDSHEQCAEFLEEAEWYLNQALAILQDSVKEPVRLIEAQYELGCVYRERAALGRHDDVPASLVAKFDRVAVEHLQNAAELARDTYSVWYVDACLALSQTYFQRGQFNETQAWLERASKAIPSVYLVRTGGRLNEIPIEERVERFWYQLGEIELLQGYLTCNTGLSTNDRACRQSLEQSLEHFVLAYAYFEHFLPQSSRSEAIIRQLHEHLKEYKPDDLHNMRESFLPRIARAYSLNESDLRSFFEVTLGAALQIKEA